MKAKSLAGCLLPNAIGRLNPQPIAVTCPLGFIACLQLSNCLSCMGAMPLVELSMIARCFGRSSRRVDEWFARLAQDDGNDVRLSA
jgi:hypothetical protein